MLQLRVSERREPKRMESTTVGRRYLRYGEAEYYTGLHRVTLWRAVRDGKLRASGVGRAIRFDVRDLDRFMSARGGDQNQ